MSERDDKVASSAEAQSSPSSTPRNGLMLSFVFGGIIACLATLAVAVFYLFTGVIGLDKGWATSGRLLLYFLAGLAFMGWGIRLALRESS